MQKGVITGLEIQKRNKERVNVFLDDEYAFSLNLMEAAKLKKGQVLSENEITALRTEDAVTQAVDSAAHFLGFRPRSTEEVRRNLADKQFAPEVAEAAIAQMEALGYLDDMAFARFWVQNRSEFKPLSHRALRQELRQKGVGSAHIDEVLSELDESELAYKAASTQMRKLRGLDTKTFHNKMANFLQRRGFSYGTARDVITRLLEELDTSDSDDLDQIRESHEE